MFFFLSFSLPFWVLFSVCWDLTSTHIFCLPQIHFIKFFYKLGHSYIKRPDEMLTSWPEFTASPLWFYITLFPRQCTMVHYVWSCISKENTGPRPTYFDVLQVQDNVFKQILYRYHYEKGLRNPVRPPFVSHSSSYWISKQQWFTDTKCLDTTFPRPVSHLVADRWLCQLHSRSRVSGLQVAHRRQG